MVKALRHLYPDAQEEVDESIPLALCPEISFTAFVNANHAHNKVTHRSITGLMIFAGCMPIFYSSKRQGAIKTSTYGAKFMAMRTAVEEIMVVRYMLQCLGVTVTEPTILCGDNMAVLHSIQIENSLLKKKHVAISYHKTREAVAANITNPVKVPSEDNFADVLTKALSTKDFTHIILCCMIGG